VAVVVDDFREAEYVVVVKEGSSDEGEVDRKKSVTIVHESFVSQRWDRQAFLHVTRHDPSKEELVENETRIHFPCIEVRAGILHEGGMYEMIRFPLARPNVRGELTSRT